MAEHPQPGSPSHPRLAELLAEVEEADRLAREVAGDLTPEQLRWRPAEAWGVGDCLEHLTVAAELYLPRAQAAVDGLREAGGSGTTAPWKRTLFGRMLLHAVTSRRKLSAPRIFRPPPSARPEVLAAFLAIQQQVATLVHALDGLPIERARLSSPVSRLLRLHAGEALEILEAHARRHLAQARRVREREGFPAA